jgi:hypothetical protein
MVNLGTKIILLIFVLGFCAFSVWQCYLTKKAYEDYEKQIEEEGDL